MKRGVLPSVKRALVNCTVYGRHLANRLTIKEKFTSVVYTVAMKCVKGRFYGKLVTDFGANLAKKHAHAHLYSARWHNTMDGRMLIDPSTVGFSLRL